MEAVPRIDDAEVLAAVTNAASDKVDDDVLTYREALAALSLLHWHCAAIESSSLTVLDYLDKL